MEQLLDQNRTYKVRTPDENWWHFKWGDYVDFAGHHWGWQAYRWTFSPAAKNASYMRQGIWKEIEVFKHLTLYAHELSDEDWDAIRFWVNVEWQKEIDAKLASSTNEDVTLAS